MKYTHKEQKIILASLDELTRRFEVELARADKARQGARSITDQSGSNNAGKEDAITSDAKSVTIR
jgi:hypothetical protein